MHWPVDISNKDADAPCHCHVVDSDSFWRLTFDSDRE